MSRTPWTQKWRPPALLLAASLVPCSFASSLEAHLWPTTNQEIEKRLSQGGVEERKDALKEGAGLPLGLLVPLVTRGLKDPEAVVRQTAAQVAVQNRVTGLGGYVREWLSSTAPAEQLLAIEVIRSGVELDDIAALGRALKSADKNVRTESAAVLALAPLSLHEQARSELIRGLGDKEPEVRKEVAAALGHVGSKELAVTLAAHLGDPEATVRQQIVVALGVLGGEAAVSSLTSALADSDEEVVASAADALGTLGAEDAVLALVSLVRVEPFREPQKSAERALSRIASERAEREILRLLVERPLGSLAAELTVEARKRSRFAACLKQARAEALKECVSGFVALGGEEQELFKLQESGKLSVSQVLHALRGRFSRQASILALERLMSGSEEGRKDALTYLGSVPEMPESVARELSSALREQKWTAAETAQVLALLAHAKGDHSALASVYLEATDRDVRSVAAELWTSSGKGGDGLESFILDPRPEVVEGAFRALSRSMTLAQGRVVLSLLEKGGEGRRGLLLQSLGGLPNLGTWKSEAEPMASKLELLFWRARGAERDAILLGMAASAGSHFPERLRAEGSEEDLRMAAGLALFTEGGEIWARKMLKAEDPRVRASVVQVLGVRGDPEDIAPITEILQSEGRAYLHSRALFALTSFARRIPKSVQLNDELLSSLCASERWTVRLGALELASVLGTVCGGAAWEDLLALDPEPLVRKAAARALRRAGTGEIALRRCESYDPDPGVAELCSWGDRAPLGQNDPPGPAFQSLPLAQTAGLRTEVPGLPVALDSSLGRLVVLTDRHGRLFVGRGQYTPLAGSLAY